MDVSVLATKDRQPACWDVPQVFASLDLDYNPADEDYAHLDEAGHAEMAARKAAAEAKAVDACFGCALMVACEQMDTETSRAPGAVFIHGVIGGRTEDERLARLGRRRGRTAAAPANPQIAPGDRGPRKQVDDALVARLTIAGKTGDQIAHDLQCSVRTVTRARKRMAAAMGAPTPPTAETIPATSATSATSAPVAETSEQPAPRTQTVPTARRKRTSTTTHATLSTVQRSTVETGSSHPFLNGRPISASMEAVYDHLSRNGATSFEDLKAIGAAQVDNAEAAEWWLNRNSTVVDGVRVIRPSKAAMSEADRIREGALAKAHNSVDAAIRKGRYLTKDSAMVTLLPEANAAWLRRKAEQRATQGQRMAVSAAA